MRKFTQLFISSSKELRNVRCITLTAMMAALSIVLGYLTFMPNPDIKIGFSFLPNNFVYYLFGPAVGAIYGAMVDILTFIIKPTGTFFPGLTLSAILTGLLYGIALYKKPVSLKRIILTNLIYMLTIEVPLNTYWLSVLNGSYYYALLPMRALKGGIMFVIGTILLYSLMKGVEATGILRMLHQEKTGIA